MAGALTYLLIDGHSIIFAWPQLRALHQRKPAQARADLIDRLRRLHDTSDWRITLVFDGREGTVEESRPGEMVVAYARTDETADSVIERLVAASGKEGKILVVTADEAERRTVEALGAETASPDWLESELTARLLDFDREMERASKRAKW
jgi:predicted RNA-binding protein with PIN domain